MNDIVAKCRKVLEDHYGDRLGGVVLYGSLARGEATQESDVDLLVLLKEPFDFFDELWVIVDILYDVQLESERLISAKPAHMDDFEQGSIQLYRNALREGIRV